MNINVTCRHMEMTDALIEAAKGKFIVGCTDLHGGGDAVAAFRDPAELLIDTIEKPSAGSAKKRNKIDKRMMNLNQQ